MVYARSNVSSPGDVSIKSFGIWMKVVRRLDRSLADEWDSVSVFSSANIVWPAVQVAEACRIYGVIPATAGRIGSVRNMFCSVINHLSSSTEFADGVLKTGQRTEIDLHRFTGSF